MFQFTGLTSDIIGYLIAKVGCPIRIFTDQRLFAPPRNFSQLITSFIVSESQGIPRTPLLTFFYLLYLQVNLNFYLFAFPICQRTFLTFSPRLSSEARMLIAFWIMLKRGYHRIRTSFLCATAYPFEVSSSMFQVQSCASILIIVTICFFNILFERCRLCALFLYSYSLSYLKVLLFWWRIRESNPWPSACKADALANWANPPGYWMTEGLIDGLKFFSVYSIDSVYSIF